MKVCSKCKASKEESEFHKQSSAKDGLHPACKSCHYERNKIYKLNNKETISQARKLYYETHKDKAKAQMKTYQQTHKQPKRTIDPIVSRTRALMNKFNMTLEEYNDMLTTQNNVCAICNQPSSNGLGLAVDHNHITGKVRDLLCHKCNIGLGMANDDITMLLKMVEYLRKHS